VGNDWIRSFGNLKRAEHKRKAEKKMVNVAKSHLPVGCAVNSGTDDRSATIAAALWVNTRQKLRHQNEARDERPGNQLPHDFVSPMSLKDFRNTSTASTVYYWLTAIFICFHTNRSFNVLSKVILDWFVSIAKTKHRIYILEAFGVMNELFK
jgi:hypothetical protein